MAEDLPPETTVLVNPEGHVEAHLEVVGFK